MSARHLDLDGVAPGPFRALSGPLPYPTVPAALADAVVDTLERTPA